MSLALRAGNNPQALRLRRGLSQIQLSAKSHVGLTTIQRLEAGKNASLLTIERLAKALNLQPWELLR